MAKVKLLDIGLNCQNKTVCNWYLNKMRKHGIQNATYEKEIFGKIDYDNNDANFICNKEICDKKCPLKIK